MTSISADTRLGESSLEEYVRRVSSFPLRDPEESQRLLERARGGDESALEAVIASHLRLVVDIALQRRGLDTPLTDLIEAGNRGLARAAERFDPHEHGPFRSYATAWIRQEMLESLEVA